MEPDYYGEYSPDGKFILLCWSQIVAIIIFIICVFELPLEKQRFSDGNEFQSIEAYNVSLNNINKK